MSKGTSLFVDELVTVNQLLDNSKTNIQLLNQREQVSKSSELNRYKTAILADQKEYQWTRQVSVQIDQSTSLVTVELVSQLDKLTVDRPSYCWISIVDQGNCLVDQSSETSLEQFLYNLSSRLGQNYSRLGWVLVDQPNLLVD